MRLLFVTYCMSAAEGQAQIGVYKRGLRIGVELADRGHDVKFFCTGRQNFHDALSGEAETKVDFVEFPFQRPVYQGAAANRAAFLAELEKMRPDVVVIGEAPMAGTLLEATLSAVESRIPVVLLDNAYNPGTIDAFCEHHGSMFDGMILCGPTIFHGRTTNPYLVQVPPYIDASPGDARRFLRDVHGLEADPVIVVLAYDPNVANLGVSLVRQLDDPDVVAVFLSPDPDCLQECLATLPGAAGRIRTVAPPSDSLLFGMIQIARCAVTKGGFMQVSECLALHTPVIGLFYHYGYSSEQLPQAAQTFVHAADEGIADAGALAAARRFLRMDPEALTVIHDGSMDAAARAADYLETLPLIPRADASTESSRLGFSRERLLRAVRNLEGDRVTAVEQVRSNHLRSFPDHDVHNVLCEYSLGDQRRFARLWGRLYHTRHDYRRALRQADDAKPPRRVLYGSARSRLFIESDLGEEVLPSIWDLLNAPGPGRG